MRRCLVTAVFAFVILAMLAPSVFAQTPKVFGPGTPRGLQGHPLDARSLEIALAMFCERLWLTTSALLAHLRLLPRVSCSHSAWAIA